MIYNLTIVIPCVDEVELLQKALLHLQDTLPEQKVIIVKMGKEAITFLDEYNLQIKLYTSPLLSSARAKNYGASLVTTDYFLLQDSDNWIKGDRNEWASTIEKAILQSPRAIFLQRNEDDRKIINQKPNKWNFGRNTINWSIIWKKEYYFNLGALDERCGTGADSLAQSGEEMTLIYRYFEENADNIYLENIKINHPSLNKPVSIDRRFQYAYGVTNRICWQFRRKPSWMAAYWLVRTILGFALDLYRGCNEKSYTLVLYLIRARAYALYDSIFTDYPRKK